MIDHRQNEIVIVEGLKAYLSTPDRPCEVVRQNQVVEVPQYPYGSYTVTTPVSESKGTYSMGKDGTLYRNIEQTWSFTVQSDDQDEALTLAMRAYDFFTASAIVMLADHGISVLRVLPVTNRDNLVSIEYEYRKGLDVTFGLLYSIKPDDKLYQEEIETVQIGDVSGKAPTMSAEELNEMLAKRLSGVM